MRVFLTVIDGFGIGEAPDAEAFGDVGSNTFLNLYNKYDLDLPFLYSLGLKNIDGLECDKLESEKLIGSYGRLKEFGCAKDTTAGHWELSGLIASSPFVTFENGFPAKLIKILEEVLKTKTLCNTSASGTAVINEFGDKHLQTGFPICYTSADSVIQIACHESVMTLNELYSFCEKLRSRLSGTPYDVGRIIARPFAGESGNYCRTAFRKDFSLEPTGETMLDILKDKGFDVIGVGKIEDIFAGRGITESYHTLGNDATLKELKNIILNKDFNGLAFINLIDTDMAYGHRNDEKGYIDCLKKLDRELFEMLSDLKDEDILIITSDHGNDPTTPSTDHSREYTPFLVYGKHIKPGVNLGTVGFSACAELILEAFGIKEGALYKEIYND